MPDNPRFGTRFFVILILAALREYLRHKPNIDNDLGSTIAAALDVLVANIDVITSWNEPGPQ
jgi:hypothetical protein